MVSEQQGLAGREILGLEPLGHGKPALGLDKPDPTIVALDIGPARFGPPEPAARGRVLIEPREHWLLDLQRAQPLERGSLQIVHAPQVVELHGQAHAPGLKDRVWARDIARPDRRQLHVVDKALFLHGMRVII
ncbi:H/ACA ribonucleoprotein complex subunit 3-like protein [Striga asiatica]|uniref:H/ACA ribonucleoprotein complex subunit 3-like protein n=1 Tax=Striga asiatica TaxID=4170 RepID=A0A5A7Q9L5_STRAF|nr:H/ACA ribonucleoprotein complex subunit 3-like protein [Striga asiatica]